MRSAAVVVVLLGIGLAACGGDDDDSSATSATDVESVGPAADTTEDPPTTDATTTEPEPVASGGDTRACRQVEDALGSAHVTVQSVPWITPGRDGPGSLSITVSPADYWTMRSALADGVLTAIDSVDDRELRGHIQDLEAATSDELQDEVDDPDDAVFPQAVYDMLVDVEDEAQSVQRRCRDLGVDIEVEDLAAPGEAATPTTQAIAPPTTQPATTSPLAPFTVEEMNAILGPPAAAWIAAPSGPTYDALAAAATSMVASGRPIPVELVDDPGWLARGGTADEVIRNMQAYPSTAFEGGDNRVIAWLNYLALTSVEVPFLLNTGSYLVNTEVPPGTYRATNVDGCYWETLDEAGEINDNNFVDSAPQVLMTVKASDYAVNNDCGVMVKID